MLVLSRKKNECIIIDENIVITVVEVRGDKVRLGIDAPKEITIHRSEIYDAIQKQALAEKIETDAEEEIAEEKKSEKSNAELSTGEI